MQTRYLPTRAVDANTLLAVETQGVLIKIFVSFIHHLYDLEDLKRRVESFNVSHKMIFYIAQLVRENNDAILDHVHTYLLGE